MQTTTHEDEFAALCTDIPEDILDSWTTKILAWELDREQPNPYFNPSSGTSKYVLLRLHLIVELSGPSELEIRRRLTLEEEKDGLAFTVVDLCDDFTETQYLLYGLDLEEQQ